MNARVVSSECEPIMGYMVTRGSAAACAAQVGEWIKQRSGLRVAVCLNPHSLVVAGKDQAFDRALRGADILLPDGFGIVVASRVLGGRIRQRCTGWDLFEETMRQLEAVRGSCFFLGSSEFVLERIRLQMAVKYPGVRLAGTYSPPFTDEFTPGEHCSMREAVNAARPDVLWVGMTAPKQEKWIADNRAQLDVPFAAAIGAVFDFFAGTVQRSHPVFQRIGLEWLPRFARQPRRMWRRNLISTPTFLFRLAQCRFIPGSGD